MTIESTIEKTFEDDPDKEYINPCCVGADEILNEIKTEVAARMNVKSDVIEIYQEDWGWALEFLKEDLIYLLGVSNETEDGEARSHIVFSPQALKKIKGIFFTKTVEQPEESLEFSRTVSSIAAENGFTII